MTKSRLLGAAGLTSLALILAACGTATIGSQGASHQQRSASATVLASMSAVKTSSYHFVMQVDMRGFGQALSSMGSTAIPDDLSTNGSGEFSGAQDAIEVSVGGSMMSLMSNKSAAQMQEIVFLSTGVVYLELPASLGGSSKWVEVSSGKGSSGGEIGSLLSSLSSASPIGYLSAFDQDITSVRAIGTAQVDGTSTTEYALVENLRSIMDGMSSSGVVGALGNLLSGGSGVAGQQYTQDLDAALRAMPPTITIDAYLDGAAHLRRLSLTMPLGAMFTALMSHLASSEAGVSGPSQSQIAAIEKAFSHLSESFTMDLTYAGAIHISAPSASEISTSDPLAGLGVSGSASASTTATLAS
jgi:hypothetical protein